MKKIYTLAALAMVAIVACNKEIEPTVEITPEKGDVTILAQAPSGTKTIVDGLDVKWAAGDCIAVFDEDGDSHEFSLDNGAGTVDGEFSGSLSGKAELGYAVYPYTANSAFDDGEWCVYVDYPTTYAYNAVTVPMWGEVVSAGEYDFNHIGGAFKIQYTNVPAGVSKFVFTSTTNITGTVTYNFSDPAALSSNEGKVVTVTGVPSGDALTFIVPVPAGSYTFSVKLLDSSENVIAGSEKTVSSAKTVAEGHIVPLKAIKVKADRDDTLWSENFEAYSANDQPTASSASVFWGGKTTYAYSGTYCKVYSGGSINGSMELLIPKSSRKETWVVSNIPTGNWDVMTLKYKTNQNLNVTSSDVTVGDATIIDGFYNRSITDAEGIASFSLTFAMGSDSNARIDDICLIAGEPLPGITVTTEAASATSTVAGTTATLNGTLTLVNGAINANVSEAGFYYKLTSAGSYTKVTCASAPTSTTSFSYDLTSLTTDSEYTYYAYAIYNSGSEVTGETTTFTPKKSAGKKTYTLTITASDFVTTSYADNNNEKTSNAVAEDSSTFEVKWTSNQVMKNSTNMQWQKSKGYIYNSTDLGTIVSVTINKSAGSFTTYYGTTEQPSSGSAGSGKGFFKSSVGGATGTTSSVVVVFEK